ncbi:M20/M25/M40 family metallo-hydrolase [Methylobacterium soli]|uniref:M20 family metallopeptidase n=1 Tax=Methylobacterium soli TaxID=553447 RepID=A0A6L3SVB4_9HYPH|nr:M20/M25/M40 family metallo-hydrolase [Methylobacterium soli]KAB1076463.1 M20 family metallopeptidase [Methylobacterium soli]GJE44676.1 N-formyl-4-amino-5-aminomethyl-2-methylpyrimidine deformylase [Methylobacterium soli]
MSSTKAVRAQISVAVDAMLPQLIAMTQVLVAAASPNPPSDTRDVAKVAEELLRRIPGVAIEWVEPEPGVVSLLARICGNGSGRRIIFNGHLDTFPIGENLPWSVPPLGGVLKDGRLYGRGVSDMKGGVAASILAASILAAHRETWAGEIVVTLAGDEENMGSLGSGYMLKHLPHASGDANICGDVGSPMVVRFGEKGLYWLEIEASGSPAHGAHVHKGVNAIDRLRTALDAVKQLEALPVQAPPVVTAAIARSASISEALSGAGETRTLESVTVNIGIIEGGISPNLVPTHALARADIRLPVGVSTQEIDAHLDAWLSPLEGVTWRVIRRFEPNYTDPEHEIVRYLTEVAEEVQGSRPALNMRVGASDSRWYRMHGIPTVVFGLTPYNMGGPDEYILTDELRVVAKVHALTAYDYLAKVL